MDMNMELNEEALPVFDEGELVFGAGQAPPPEGTYAVNPTLGKNGVKYDKDKGVYNIHVVNTIVKPLKYVHPGIPGEVVDESKTFFNPDGSGRQIHDFLRLSASNPFGIKKAVKFLKYAGDPEYNKYPNVGLLAKAVVEALESQPDTMKVNTQWRASAETGVDQNGKKVYTNVQGMKKFPLNQNGSISHVAFIEGEEVPAQTQVVEYGELTAKDAV